MLQLTVWKIFSRDSIRDFHLACIASIFFGFATVSCSGRRHVETPKREVELGQVKGSGGGGGENSVFQAYGVSQKKNEIGQAYFFLVSLSPIPSFAPAPTLRVGMSTVPNLPLA